MIHAGLAIGLERAQDAANAAGEDWRTLAIDAFRRHARNNRFFTTEQVRAANKGLPEPPDKRAWGSIPRAAVSEGLIQRHSWARADSKSVHGMIVTQWESCIFDEATQAGSGVPEVSN